MRNNLPASSRCVNAIFRSYSYMPTLNMPINGKAFQARQYAGSRVRILAASPTVGADHRTLSRREKIGAKSFMPSTMPRPPAFRKSSRKFVAGGESSWWRLPRHLRLIVGQYALSRSTAYLPCRRAAPPLPDLG